MFAILLGLFLGSALYWYLNKREKKDNRYCPCCGRMLLVYEQEEKKTVDGFYKVDYTHDKVKAKVGIEGPKGELGVCGTAIINTLPSWTSIPAQYRSFNPAQYSSF
jgi:hypothetical protein